MKVLDHGFVRLIDTMPREDLDASIVRAARVSYGNGTTSVNGDRGLIRYLLRNAHTTPFEMVEFKFHIKMPIFLARQHMRHRTASINEISGRYSELPDEFYVPETFRGQSVVNRQGSDGTMDVPDSFATACRDSFALYQELLQSGVSRELARMHLPLNTYTEFYWKVNLHNLLHYLRLRMDDHAQWEIQEYARAMHSLVAPLAPFVFEAYEDYVVGSVNLSRLDVDKIRHQMKYGTHEPYPSRSEENDLLEKMDVIGLKSL